MTNHTLDDDHEHWQAMAEALYRAAARDAALQAIALYERVWPQLQSERLIKSYVARMDDDDPGDDAAGELIGPAAW